LVEISSTDVAGNSGSCIINVTLSDVSPPVVTCPADIIVSESDDHSEWTFVQSGKKNNKIFGGTATDNSNFEITYNYSASNDLVNGMQTVIAQPLPKNTVNVIEMWAFDSSGNAAGCEFTIVFETACLVDPCQNGGICETADEDASVAVCNCDFTGFSGSSCEIGLNVTASWLVKIPFAEGLLPSSLPSSLSLPSDWEVSTVLTEEFLDTLTDRFIDAASEACATDRDQYQLILDEKGDELEIQVLFFGEESSCDVEALVTEIENGAAEIVPGATVTSEATTAEERVAATDDPADNNSELLLAAILAGAVAVVLALAAYLLKKRKSQIVRKYAAEGDEAESAYAMPL
jgi:hypothetical protein